MNREALYQILSGICESNNKMSKRPLINLVIIYELVIHSSMTCMISCITIWVSGKQIQSFAIRQVPNPFHSFTYLRLFKRKMDDKSIKRTHELPPAAA